MPEAFLTSYHEGAPAQDTADIKGEFRFPLHCVVATDLHLDIVWWDDTNKSIHIVVVELTNSFTTHYLRTLLTGKEPSILYQDTVSEII